MLQSVNQKATDLQIWRALRSKERLIVASDGGLDKSAPSVGPPQLGRPCSLKEEVLLMGPLIHPPLTVNTADLHPLYF
jgi:hypothetical protein